MQDAPQRPYRKYTQVVRGRYMIADAPTENLWQAMYLHALAKEVSGKLEKSACWKSAVILAVTAVESELIAAAEVEKAKQQGLDDLPVMDKQRITLKEELHDVLRLKKFKGALKLWAGNRLGSALGSKPLQFYCEEVCEYRNKIVHFRTDDWRLLRKYDSHESSLNAIRVCRKSMELISEIFEHQTPQVLTWWSEICPGEPDYRQRNV